MNIWQQNSEELVYDGFRKILRREYTMPDGREEVFDVKKEGTCSVGLALTKNKEVILGKQYRPGPNKLLLELPGGRVEVDQTPIEAMKEELLQETGYAGAITPIGENIICAYSTGRRHFFVITDCKRVSDQQLDKNEFIDVVLMPVQEFKNHILEGGELSDGEAALRGLHFLHLL